MPVLHLQNKVMVISIDDARDPELERVAQSRSWMLLRRPTLDEAVNHIMVNRPQAVIIQVATSTDMALELVRRLQTRWVRMAVIVAVVEHTDNFEREARMAGATCYLPGHEWVRRVDEFVDTMLPQDRQTNRLDVRRSKDRLIPAHLIEDASNHGEGPMTRLKTNTLLPLIATALLVLSNTALAKVTLPSDAFKPAETVLSLGRLSSGGEGSQSPIIALSEQPEQSTLLPFASLGNVKLKLTNAEGFFAPMNGGDLDGDVDLGQRPRAPLSATSPAQVGDEFFVVYRITTYNVDGGEDIALPAGKELVGLMTYLQVSEIKQLTLGKKVIGSRIGLTDSSREHSTAPSQPGSMAQSIGRFYLFEANTDQGPHFVPDAGVFDASGGRPGDIDFSTGFGDLGHTATDSGGREFLTDVLANFADPSMRLVIAASVEADAALDDDGEVDEIFELLITNDKKGFAFNGLLNNVNLNIDGGDWFASIPNPKQAGLGATLIGYDGSVDNYDELGSTLKGDRSVFDAGWQAASEDPIEFYVPEPSTLLLLTIGGVMIGRRRPRRQAA